MSENTKLMLQIIGLFVGTIILAGLAITLLVCTVGNCIKTIKNETKVGQVSEKVVKKSLNNLEKWAENEN